MLLHPTFWLLMFLAILWSCVSQAQDETVPQPQVTSTENKDTTAPNEATDLLDAIRQRGELRIGLSIFPPWTMRNQEGELIGFEIDIAKQLAKDLDVKTVFVPNSWNSIIADLLDERYDIIISGMSVTPMRALQVEFSDFYGFSEFNVLASRAKAGDFKTIVDFNKPAVTLGVRAGGTAAEIAKRHFPNATLTTFDSDTELFQAVHKGEIHGAVAASPRPELDAQRYAEQVLIPIKEPLAQRGEAFAIRKDNQRLLNFLNAWIGYHTLDGFLSRRRDYWFNSTAWVDQL